VHVAVNALHLVPGETGGLEVYARRLLPALLEQDERLELTVLASREGAPGLSAEPWAGERARVVRVPVNARSRARRVLAEQVLIRRAVRRAGASLLHNLFNTAPAMPGVPQVTTIHDLIYRTQTSASPLVLGQALLVPLAARRSRRLIAVSEATKGDLVRSLHVPAERIDVAPNGPGREPVRSPDSEAGLRERFGLGDRPLLLTVSAKLPHKNLGRLIEAVGQLQGSPPPVLLVPGYRTALEAELRAQAAKLPDDRVRFLGWLDEAALDGLYGAAACFVFPSLAEGFGMPLLEAMQRGSPVACSDIEVHREVAADAALYFEPRDPGSIAAALGRLLADEPLRLRLAEAGRGRVPHFSWARAAQATLAGYRRALADSTRS
jgi:glycosyltransferase involved in cell wall biosynthesis